jgi:hypothetical protein
LNIAIFSLEIVDLPAVLQTFERLKLAIIAYGNILDVGELVDGDYTAQLTLHELDMLHAANYSIQLVAIRYLIDLLVQQLQSVGQHMPVHYVLLGLQGVRNHLRVFYTDYLLGSKCKTSLHLLAAALRIRTG